MAGCPVLLASTTTDPKGYTDGLDWGWRYRGYEAFKTRGKCRRRSKTEQFRR